MIGNATETLAKFRKMAGAEETRLIETICSGPYTSFDQYKHEIGRLAGIRSMLGILEEIERQVEKETLGR